MTIRLDIVTVERVVFSDDVDIVVAPGVDGVMGILPNHTPLMTTLNPGELVARKSGQEYALAISGGFLEVRPERVIVLADSAERAEEIDITRAEAAKKRAQEELSRSSSQLEAAAAEAALHRATVRLNVVAKRKRNR